MKRIYISAQYNNRLVRPSRTAAKLRLTRALLFGNKSSKTKEGLLTYDERLQTSRSAHKQTQAKRKYFYLYSNLLQKKTVSRYCRPIIIINIELCTMKCIG